MNMMTRVVACGELDHQADVARSLGSPFVAAVLEAGQRQLARAPHTQALIAGWPRDPSASALAMRFNAALHALARRGALPELSALYRREHEDYDGAIGAALAAEDAFIADWMGLTPQTNEVGRAAAIVAALTVAHAASGMPFELLEVGASCGLNLNLARYAYDLGGTPLGTGDSPVHIAPDWRGSAPVAAPIEVVGARGVDLSPLRADHDATRERLLAYVWADQPTRARRLEQALALAQRHPPTVERGDAATWVAERLSSPQRPGVCRVLFHSMVLQYLSAVDRHSVAETIRRAGSRATMDRPLAWIGFEWTPLRSEVQLTLTSFPTGDSRVLATCHAYGDWVDWHA